MLLLFFFKYIIFPRDFNPFSSSIPTSASFTLPYTHTTHQCVHVDVLHLVVGTEVRLLISAIERGYVTLKPSVEPGPPFQRWPDVSVAEKQNN